MIDNAAWRIQHALAYPFDPPDQGYLYAGGKMRDLAEADYSDRVPVIASGSNGSPARLREKYGTDHVVPVTRVRLSGLIPAYAARITSYGSVPATLAPLENTSSVTHCTWLTAEQLEIMHLTESVGVGYAYCAVNPALCMPMEGPPLDGATAYISLAGFLPDREQLPMSLESHDQAKAQAKVRELAESALEQNEFVASNILNEEHRKSCNDRLATIGITVRHAALTRLL